MPNPLHGSAPPFSLAADSVFRAAGRATAVRMLARAEPRFHQRRQNPFEGKKGGGRDDIQAPGRKMSPKIHFPVPREVVNRFSDGFFFFPVPLSWGLPS